MLSRLLRKNPRLEVLLPEINNLRLREQMTIFAFFIWNSIIFYVKLINYGKKIPNVDEKK